LIDNTNLDESYIFKISIKIRFFNVTIGIKIPLFLVSVTTEPGRSLLQFVTTNCLITINFAATMTTAAIKTKDIEVENLGYKETIWN